MIKESLFKYLNGKFFSKFLPSYFIWALLFTVLVGLTGCQNQVHGMLDPKGVIAFEERKLFFDTLALMLIVVLPVIIMSIAFVYHYQVSHRVRDYKPNWSHSYLLESLWWGIPCVIILVLAILTWKKTYELDPYQKIDGYNDPPLVIQAIALPWKWLFIYPEQNIATVNYVQIPVDRQIEYWFTTDNVPMSAFFIPQLGSQIYALAGMSTRLYLSADQPGDYIGLNTMFNGDGFSDMHFAVRVVSADQMDQWFKQVKQSAPALTDVSYQELVKPSENDQTKFYGSVPTNLFQNVLNTYMHSSGVLHPRENQLNTQHLATAQEGHHV